MNPFAEWIKINGLTKHDVAVAWQVGDPAVFKICKPGHWPTRDVALRIFRFTGGTVTPNDMFGMSTLPAPQRSAEYRLALKTIQRARQRKERSDAEREKKRKPRTETGRPEQRPG